MLTSHSFGSCRMYGIQRSPVRSRHCPATVVRVRHDESGRLVPYAKPRPSRQGRFAVDSPPLPTLVLQQLEDVFMKRIPLLGCTGGRCDSLFAALRRRRPGGRRHDRRPPARLPTRHRQPTRRRRRRCRRPSRIVSLSPTATEMLFAIGAGDQVMAVDDQSNYPPEALREATRPVGARAERRGDRRAEARPGA